MTLTYRLQHLFTPGSPKSEQGANDVIQTNNSFSIPASRHGHSLSNYASASTDSKGVGMLDIRDIDHEAIKNDSELRGKIIFFSSGKTSLITLLYLELSRNPDAFNASTEDEYEEYYDSDEDPYAGVEYLSHNPEAERQLRQQLNDPRHDESATLNLIQTFRRNPPAANRERPTTAENRGNLASNRRPPINLQPPANPRTTANLQTAHNSEESDNSENSEGYTVPIWKPFFYNIFKASIFVFFMIYWILKVPIIRAIACIKIIASTLIIYPILHIWSLFPNNNESWMPNRQLRKKIISWYTFIVLFSLGIHLLTNKERYLNSTIDYWNDLVGQHQKNVNMVYLRDIVKEMTADNIMIWKTVERIENQDFKNIWTKVNQNEIEINKIKESLDKEIHVESKLPDMIFARTNKNGKLELSPEFHTHFKDLTSWDNFLKQNEESLKKYLSGEMNQFAKQKQSEEGIVGKDAFLKLLLIALHDQQPNINQDNVESFDGLIGNTIQKYHQDALNSADFALKSRGANVVYDLTSQTYYTISTAHQMYRWLANIYMPFTAPQMAIMPQTHVGECWAMSSNSGSLGIKLSQPIIVQRITVEYPSAQVMNGNMSNAPKDIEVYGYPDYRNYPSIRKFLGKLTYDINKDMPIQTFDIDSSKPCFYDTISININSNWGSLVHTDIYRIRVHGTPALKLE